MRFNLNFMVYVLAHAGHTCTYSNATKVQKKIDICKRFGIFFILRLGNCHFLGKVRDLRICGRLLFIITQMFPAINRIIFLQKNLHISN